MSIDTLNREKPEGTTSGPQWDNLEERSYDARLVYIADLGMSDVLYKGEFKGTFQHYGFCFEVPGEGIEVDGEYIGRTLWYKPVKILKNKMSSQELEIYKAFVPKAEITDKPDWISQLDKPVSITIKHNKSGEFIYDNIVGISFLDPRLADTVGPSTVELAVGSFNNPSNIVYSKLRGLVNRVYNNALERLKKDQADGDSY